MSTSLETGLYVFVLSTFLGFEVIRRVPKLLHTPLMALTNALSGVALVGSLVVAGAHTTTLSTILGATAVAASSINVVGGFMITDRMLRMFHRRAPKTPTGDGAVATGPTASAPATARRQHGERAVQGLFTLGAAAYLAAAALFVWLLTWAASGNDNATRAITTVAYLLAGAFFVLALRWLTDPPLPAGGS